ncbi:MAG: GNAT family N-acetyltransferase [Rhodanobacter sp.]
MLGNEPLPNTLELTDGNMSLRPWRDADIPGLAAAVRESVASVGRWLPWCRADYTAQDATAWVAHCQAGWRSGAHFAFALVAAHSGEILGGAGLSQRNRSQRSANLGYWVRQSRQRHGVGSTAARRVARFGFEQLGLIRIEVVVLPDNAASRATAERIGANLEVIARHRLWTGGHARDAAVYSLLPPDLD